MNISEVIISPLVSEKTTMMREQKVFCFNVHISANKIEIAAAIKHHFNARVVNCRTLIIKPKPKRVRNILGKTKRIKKAYVCLHKADTISLFEGV